MNTTTPTTMISGIATSGGQHCETTALGVLLDHAGLTLSEPMLFGLGAGLSFVYWDSKAQPMPFLGGRVKPFVLTQNLTRNLGLDLDVHETRSAAKAWRRVGAAIDQGVPVGMQLDSYYLEYFTAKVHFAGHVAAAYGYDDDNAYLVDTAQQGGAVTTSLASLAEARAARGPMSAPQRSFTVSVSSEVNLTGAHLTSRIMAAIVECANDFVNPPIANLGHRGIATAAARIPSWLGRVDDPADIVLIATLMERAGTGGALFRNLYRDFLTEALQRLDGDPRAAVVEQGRNGYAEAAELWTRVAGLIAEAGTDQSVRPLTEAGSLLTRIAGIETAAMTTLAGLGER